MRFDRNRSLRNLKFYFEIEIFSQYNVSVLVGSLTSPPGASTPLGWYIFKMGIFQKNSLVPLKRMVEPYIWNSLKQNYRQKVRNNVYKYTMGELSRDQSMTTSFITLFLYNILLMLKT